MRMIQKTVLNLFQSKGPNVREWYHSFTKMLLNLAMACINDRFVFLLVFYFLFFKVTLTKQLGSLFPW